MKEYDIDSTWRMINAFSVEIIDKKEFDSVREKNNQNKIKYIDLELYKKEWLEYIWYQYMNSVLANIFWNYKNKINDIVYYWKPNSDWSKTQKINIWWDKYIKFSDRDDKQVHNLCWYINIVSWEFNKNLNELDLLYKKITKIINSDKCINILNDRKNLDWTFVHNLRVNYNIFIANIVSMFEYIDLFIVIENLFYEKTIDWNELENKEIKLRGPRKKKIRTLFQEKSIRWNVYIIWKI